MYLHKCFFLENFILKAFSLKKMNSLTRSFYTFFWLFLEIFVAYWTLYPFIWTVFNFNLFDPIQNVPFWDCPRKVPHSKICHTCPTKIKFDTVQYYLKKIQKNIYNTWHTPWVLLASEFFQWRSANFAISRNANIDCILVHNSWLF